MRVGERAVDSRVRLGQSKISGTVRGVFGAGVGILGMIWRLWRRDRAERLGADVIVIESGT